MKLLRVAGHLAPDEVFRRYRACADGRVKTRWQAIWLMVRPGEPLTAEGAAQAVGLSDVWVRKLVHRYNANGPDGLADGRQGNGARPKLTEAQQAELFAALQAEPPDGGVWTGPKVAAFARDRLGAAVGNHTGWRWLRGLGFRLKVPRPRRPRAATAEQQRRWQRRPRPVRR
ncbi:MAG TPA: helix-turn-helix domain-containing protein [Vicinamibacteria bacterium]|nr:helix-turn-helix domain-containing protein [Vicinamibacteria bacterium]